MNTFTVVAEYNGQPANFTLNAESSEEVRDIVEENFEEGDGWFVMGWTWATFVPGTPSLSATKASIENSATSDK